MATRPQKTTNEPFWQAAVQRFSDTRNTPRVVVIPPPLSHARKALSTGHKATISTEAKKITRPSGAATPEEADTRHRRASASSGCSFGDDFAGSSRPCCGRGRESPCFAVCDSSPKAECVPAFACKSERGPFVREVENAMRNGWEQRCDGNFLAIFAGVSIGEKSNFLSRIFE